MVKLTQSLRHWLWENHRDLIVPITFGHLELFTKDMEREYLAWCHTDEGRQYLKGGSMYKEEDKVVISKGETTTTDAEPVTAEWIPWEVGGKASPVLVTCSSCKRGQWNKNAVWEFVHCPKCGKKMRRMEK